MSIEKLNKIGIALSSERNINNLLEMIVDESMNITNADGGTLYLMIDDNSRLKFEIVKNKSLGINNVGISKDSEIFYPVKLFNPENGSPNDHFVSAYCALSGKTINISDAYQEKGFDFSGTKNVDKKFKYRSKSTLNVPLKDHEDKIIGVLQLWNSTCPNTNKVIPFSDSIVELIESLTSQAAVALNNTRLIDNLEELFNSLVQYTVKAIDARSPHTAGHSSRVAKLTRKLAESVNSMKNGKYKDINYNADELYEIWISGLVHDVGKIGTPESILDKRNKLDGSKFDLVLEKFKHYRSIISLKLKGKELDDKLKCWNEDFDFINKINKPGKMSSNDLIKLKNISMQTFNNGFEDILLVNEEEYKNLSIEYGNLTNDERKIIQEHIVHTKKLLNKLNFPEKLKNVPSYAGSHHENINGSGYPSQLKGDEIPLPGRMMAIVDIWEAVTAPDRPYRPPANDELACKIIREEASNGKLDIDLVELFINEEIWKNKKA